MALVMETGTTWPHPFDYGKNRIIKPFTMSKKTSLSFLFGKLIAA